MNEVFAFKERLLEEIEFVLVASQKTNNQNLIAGLEKAIQIIEETE